MRGTLAVAAAAAVAGYALAGLMTGVTAILAALVLAAFFYMLLMPLADAYALRGLAQRGRSYGPVRLWGSAAFIVGSFGCGPHARTDRSQPPDLAPGRRHADR